MGRLEQDLAAHDIIAVDTAPFIYLWERHPRYFRLSETLFRHLKETDTRGITSVITLIEACVYPHRQGRFDLVQAYEQALLQSQQVRMLLIDAVLARRAVVLRSKYNIHVPDALQIAAAIESSATLFVTNDRRVSNIEEIQTLLFDDYVM